MEMGHLGNRLQVGTTLLSVDIIPFSHVVKNLPIGFLWGLW